MVINLIWINKHFVLRIMILKKVIELIIIIINWEIQIRINWKLKNELLMDLQ
jgi:hypothetical protein